MGRKPKKVILKDREFDSIKDFLEACNASSWSWSNASRKGMSEQEFFDIHTTKEKKEEKKEEKPVVAKENNISKTTTEKPVVESIIPNKFLADSNNIINKIKMIDSCMINLIDFENVVGSDILDPYLKNPRCINIFFYNALLYSNDYYKAVKDSKSNNFQIITMEKGDQLVDHLISFYLGIFITNMPSKNYNIISRDSGYLNFVHFIGMENIRTIGTGYIPSSKKKFDYSVCNFFANNKELREGIAFSETDLTKQIDSFYNQRDKRPTVQNYRDVIDLLVNYSVLNREGSKLYSINKNEAHLVCLDIQNGIK